MSYRYGDVVAPYIPVNEPLSVEDQHFVDCVLTGMKPLSDARSGLAVVAVLEAAQRSLRERREVCLEEVWGDALLPARGPAGARVILGPGPR
jgi:predicted dehydrogenase